MVKRVIRRSFRLALLGGLFWLGRTAFKRWVEGPEPTGSDSAWPPSSHQSPTGSPVAAPPSPVAPSPAQAASSSTADEVTWVRPDGDGEPPDTHPIKAKVSSRVYRVPGMSSYDQTKADRCYPSAEAAEADGFTKAKR